MEQRVAWEPSCDVELRARRAKVNYRLLTCSSCFAMQIPSPCYSMRLSNDNTPPSACRVRYSTWILCCQRFGRHLLLPRNNCIHQPRKGWFQMPRRSCIGRTMAAQMGGEEGQFDDEAATPLIQKHTIVGPADQELVVMSKVSRRFRLP